MISLSDDTLECLDCYELFTKREDNPIFRVCQNCAPDPKAYIGYNCPNCGWSCEKYNFPTEGEEKLAVIYKNVRPDWEYGYCGGKNWTEEWTCPECSHVFEVENGNV